MIEIYGVQLKNYISKEDFDRLLGFVSEEKKERIRRFRKYDDAERSLIADILLRVVICKKIGLKNDELSFYKNEYGKPLLKNMENIYFSISHSYDWVVVAVNEFSIGIDIEKIKPINLNIAKRFFTDDEYNFIMDVDVQKRLEYFFKLWTLKESYVKLEGKGLYTSLKSFSIIINDYNINIKTDNELKNCFFREYNIDAGYKLAVCSLNNDFPDNIIIKGYNDLLEIKDL
ncbi:4'-phosphopantetheinyl transferase superfamily protein [Thermoanaerobacterium sp. RBIITD]|uniref:4'-phosphopantetheinyl transferase family protein n=1 Tax=Thermoanaerobacterium sp. RBIITD TaxID=1550240 RepID=UPI000BB7C626|nr:4'-phosphopantetheinyl transferase superfamily protein [Thermoanaerobacterium sp. RBIITD]SNX54846.1 4'-phosphopantetheinyl transferase [Thermoanaerobacterium sp. RBIITD]